MPSPESTFAPAPLGAPASPGALTHRPAAMSEKLEALVKAALERAGYVDTGTLLVVAVSGGPDSLALLHCLTRLTESTGLRLHVAHLNHDFRGEEAEEDARFVSSVAGHLGLPVTVERADPLAYQKEMQVSSFEEAARELRYRFLGRLAGELGAAAVALGHTSDDLAETVLMHIVRGSGIHGLRGMEELSVWQSRTGGSPANLFRPLLGATRKETGLYCREGGIGFREDSSNLDLRFTRNRVRHQLLPSLESYNPRIREALVRLAWSAALEVSYLEEQTASAWARAALEGDRSVVLDTHALASLHPLLRRLVLRRAYERVAGDTRRLEEVHLEAMEEAIRSPAGRVRHLPRGLKLHSAYGQLILGREDTVPCPFPSLVGERELEMPSTGGESAIEICGWRVSVRLLPQVQATGEDPYLGSFDGEALGSGLSVRSRRPGDRFQPLGMGEEKKLQDFFVDQKVPRTWRDRIPLLVSERGIAWVVGYRVAEWARVRDDTQRVRQIRFALKL